MNIFYIHSKFSTIRRCWARKLCYIQAYQNIDLGATSHGVQEVAECGFVNPKTTPILPKILTEINFSQLLEWTEVKIFSDGLTAT